MVYSGDCPGEGMYICNNCGVSIKLETDTTELPPCPECGEKEFLTTK